MFKKVTIKWDEKHNHVIAVEGVDNDYYQTEEQYNNLVSGIYKDYESMGYDLPKGKIVAVVNEEAFAKTLYLIMKLDNDSKLPITERKNGWSYPEFTFWSFACSCSGRQFGLFTLPGTPSSVVRPYLKELIQK